jgi:hypothetical protein
MPPPPSTMFLNSLSVSGKHEFFSLSSFSRLSTTTTVVS